MVKDERRHPDRTQDVNDVGLHPAPESIVGSRWAQGEPTSLVHTLDVVPDAEVADLLQREGLRLRPGVLRVSYARGCEFHGYFAPHLVVQSDHGPVTVLVLPHERTRATLEHINKLGFDAVIVPAPRGVLVAVGRGATVGIVAQAALHALDYST